MKQTITNQIAKLLLQTVTATVCLLFCASLAHATGLVTAINGGGNVSLTGASDPNPDAVGGGSPLATSGFHFYSYDSGADFGFLDSYVYGAGVDPLNTLGGLTFVYAITNAGSGIAPLELGQLQIGNSSTVWGTTVELGYAPASFVDPTTGSLNAPVVTFNWTPPAGNSEEYYVVVGTAEQNYGLETAIVGDGSGGNSANVSVLTPVQAPEPSTMALLGPLGSGLIFALRRARRPRCA